MRSGLHTIIIRVYAHVSMESPLSSVGRYLVGPCQEQGPCSLGASRRRGMYIDALPPAPPKTHPQPVFRPDQPYDKEGIFTGCFHPGPVVKSDIKPSDVKDQVAIFYTSVPKLPIHWTREHGRGQEGVACAVSNDGGQTCEFNGNVS